MSDYVLSQLVLLIGGPERIDGTRVRMSELDSHLMMPHCHHSETFEPVCTEEVYRLEKLAVGEEVFPFYVHNSMSGREAILMLLDGYRGAK